MGKFVDLTGRKFGNLIVLHRADDYVKPNNHKIVQWECLCDCGKRTVVRGEYLKSGHTTSCGCNKSISHCITHGQTNTRLYKIWIGMKERCYNPKTISYKWYGANGVTVCEEWEKFDDFYNWAIKNGYADDLTIDRINTNGNYEPTNCRWATNKEQANNRSTNRVITYNGETHTLEQWSAIVGIPSNTIRMRTDVYGWDTERALFYKKPATKKAE